ncbi:MAG: phosphoribosylamine-glycine ligase [Flavobacteriales bacterium]|jgi:phosphoribosylamine-glycine ligase
MIIYNVTINIEEAVTTEWLSWMQEKHIPAVLATGKFTKALMTKVLVEEEMGGHTFSIQYSCPDKATLEAYYAEDADRLQGDTGKFAGKFVAFRTELEVISNH